MTKKTLRIGGMALALGLLAAGALWSAQAFGARAAKEPAAYSGIDEAVFLVVDRGHFSGQAEVLVMAAPQLLAWQPGSDFPRWTTEAGFVLDVYADEAGGRLFVLDQRKAGEDSLQDLRYSPGDTDPPSEEWPLVLTQMDAEDGRVLSQHTLDIASLPTGVFYSAAMRVLAVNGDEVLMYSYTEGDRLFSYDLKQRAYGEQTWMLCEGNAFPVEVHYNADAGEVYALCHAYYSGMQAWVTGTSLTDGSQWHLDIPALGAEDYMVGNGLVYTLDGRLLVLDTDAGVLVQVDVTAGSLGEIVHYRPEQEASAAPWWQRLFGVRTATAKRWFAFTALSPDGRWLAVDDGIREGDALRFWLVDLANMETATAVQVKVTGYPLSAMFDDANVLWIMTEKGSSTSGSPVTRFDPASGEQTVLYAALGSWPSDFVLLP
ncbi:MAG: hypothetical protein EPO32_06180 [Anaerolineae bacterium]|nr:MAG: hypothetical protein EPO32_06180 [Anaerolineae bacterium]